jgi:anti-sigma regulatory factor (Ser/Thr protein kinase)
MGTYEETEFSLSPGSTILLYTDGLVERRRISIDRGLEHLAAAAREHRGDLDGLCDHLLATLDPAGEDDVALLALQPVSLAPGRLRLALPAEPATLAGVRRVLGRWLEQVDADRQESYEIVLACNEAFANAIEHAYGPSDGSVEMEASLLDGAVSVTVRDHGRWREPRGENRGRGLALMEEIMDTVDVTKGDREGTEVRMLRKLGRAHADGH